nr:hypothetical protein [Tanacetum cinerariifolium]
MHSTRLDLRTLTRYLDNCKRGGYSLRGLSYEQYRMAKNLGVTRSVIQRTVAEMHSTRESARDVYSKHIIIAVTKLQIVEWHNYKHLDWITIHTLTPELLAGPTYELMKGSCKSLVELEFFLEEVHKATTDQLDWNNPEGQQYPPHASTTDTKLPRSSHYLV